MSTVPPSSKDVAAFLSAHRDNDLKVDVGRGNLVPVTDVHYDHTADTLVVELDQDETGVAFWGLPNMVKLRDFDVDTLKSGSDSGWALEFTLECRRCDKVVHEFTAPYSLTELIVKALDHDCG